MTSKIKINASLEKDLIDYCKLNNLKPSEYVNDLLKKAFMRDKYGDKPSILFKDRQKQETQVQQQETIIITSAPKEEPQETIPIIETKIEEKPKNKKRKL